jgi:hypothetical protein
MPCRHVFRQEHAGVVAAVAEGHLRQVVGAEAEEVGHGQPVSCAMSAARGTSIIVPTK